MSDDTWLTDERVAELLKEEKAEKGRLHPEMLAALLEIKQRRSWGRTAPAPARPAQFSEGTTRWARAALETGIQNLYDDPYGVAGEGRELAVLEAWEELVAAAAELGLEAGEVAGRLATAYEQERMEKILSSGRWARSQVAGEPPQPEELEAL